MLKEYIFDKEKFGLAVSVYKEYSNYIGKEIPNCVQFKYLEQLYLNDNFAGHAFMRPLYNRLEGTNVHILEDYKYFFEFREKLSGILSKELKTAIKMRLPKSDDVSFEVCKMHTLLECLEEGGEEDRLIKERKALGTYEYEGDKYIVVLPASAWDFCMEAYNQGNCLWDSYYKKHAYGKTTILFVCKKDNPDKSFVTIEVKDYIINEVSGKYNCIPPKEVILFLKEYAKRNWLFFDVFNYALHAVDGEEPVSKDFLEFFETLEAKDKEYWRARCGNCGLDNVEFKQLRILECFPGEPENDEPIKGCESTFSSCFF